MQCDIRVDEEVVSLVALAFIPFPALGGQHGRQAGSHSALLVLVLLFRQAKLSLC